jgi:hypothetical protein
MVQARLARHVDDAAERSGLGIRATEHDPAQACLNDRPDAHHARLDGDEQLGVDQPVVALRATRCAQGDDLGVRARIVRADRRVAAATDDLALAHHDRADRHLPGALGGRRLEQAFAHALRVCKWFVHAGYGRQP